MGWFGNTVDRVRAMFVQDKDRKAIDTTKGRISAREQMGSSFNVFSHTGYDGLAEHLRLEHDLLTRYVDYEEMDDFPEISSAIDIYADDATQVDSLRGTSVWVTSDSERVKTMLNDLLHKRLRVEEDIWPLARVVAKYGNGYAEVLLNEEGVVGLNFLPPPTMRRMEDTNGALLGFIQDPNGQGVSLDDFKKMIDDKGALKTTNKAPGARSPVHGAAQMSGTNRPVEVVPFEDWEVVHWRLRSKHMRSIYGHSVLEPARWVWRRLVLLEDAAILYKLTRAPARYAFYIDTGDLQGAQALAYVKNIKQQYKKKKFIDSQGKLDFRVNPLSQDEDFWIPSRGGKESTRIDVLSGPDWQSMDDIEYFRQKLFAAIKVPASYAGLSGEDSKGSLAQQDIRFARTVIRLQREVRNGLKKVCRIHLIAMGIDPQSVEWDLTMTVPSSIFELAQIEVRSAQAQLAASMEEYVPKKWLLKHVFDFADDEIPGVRQEKETEQEQEGTHAALIQKKQNDILGIEEGEPKPPGQKAAAPKPEKKESTLAHTDIDKKLDALLRANRDLLERVEKGEKKTLETVVRHLRKVSG